MGSIMTGLDFRDCRAFLSDSGELHVVCPVMTACGPVALHIESSVDGVDVGTSPQRVVASFPVGWWNDIVLVQVPNWTPDLFMPWNGMREADLSIIGGYAPALERAKRKARARQLSLLYDEPTGLIIVPDAAPDAILEPWMVRQSDFAAGSPERFVEAAREFEGEIRGTAAVDRVGSEVRGAVDTALGFWGEQSRRLAPSIWERLKRLALSVLLDPWFWVAMGVRYFVPNVGWIPAASFAAFRIATVQGVET